MKISAEERFRRKVDKAGGPDACWLWMAARNKAGYGKFKAGGRMVYSHRYAWEIAHGLIPDGLRVLHRCDNPPCVNPAHLFLGTDADNVADKEAKGRGNHPRGGRNGGAKLNEAQVQEIRAAYAAGGVSQAELGLRFAVSHMAISCIVRGKKWKTETKEK